VPDDLVRSAGAVRDPPVEWRQHKPTLRIPGHEGVKTATEPVDLDDVPDLNPL